MKPALKLRGADDDPPPPPPPPPPPRRRVNLRGEYGGPGKEADSMSTRGEAVYLMNPDLPTGEKIACGTEVVVEGTLRHRKAVENPDQSIQAPPAAYFIDLPTVRVAK